MQRNRQITFRVDVVGRAWQGFRACLSYNFTTLVGPTAIKAKAGDFEFIEDYCVTRITNGGTWEHEWTRRKIVRDWQSEECAEWFQQAELANA